MSLSDFSFCRWERLRNILCCGGWAPPMTLVMRLLGPVLLIIFLANAFSFENVLASRMLGVVLLMGTYWISEVIPLAATALFPLLLLPLTGVLSAENVAKSYINDNLMLFLGTFIIGLAMEKHNLHTRVAVRLILAIGDRPRLLLLGLMAGTLFVSMIMSNTSTTAVVAPLVMSIVKQFEKSNGDINNSNNNDDDDDDEVDSLARDRETDDDDIEIVESGFPETQTDAGNDDTAAQLSTSSATKPWRLAAGPSFTIDDDRAAVPSKSLDQRASVIVIEASDHNDDNGGDEDDDEVGDTVSRSARENTAALLVPEEEDDVLELEETNEAAADSNDEASRRAKDGELYGKAMLLGLAYSANTGGTGTPIGTAPNVVLLVQLAALFPHAPGISFFQWMAFAVPLAIVQTLMIFGFMVWRFLRNRRVSFDTRVFEGLAQSLGPMSYAEKIILADILIIIALWVTRSGFGSLMPGWKTLFAVPVGDGTVAVFGALLLFVWDIVDWKNDLLHLQWDILILLGGGGAMASGCMASGLSKMLAEEIEHLGDLPFLLQIFTICGVMTFLTELISNVAAANLALPILATLAISLNVNPLLFLVPATIACSYAFMFPISTPPNAIVFSYGLISIKDMATAGFLLNLLGVISLSLWTTTGGLLILGDIHEAGWIDP